MLVRAARAQSAVRALPGCGLGGSRGGEVAGILARIWRLDGQCAKGGGKGMPVSARAPAHRPDSYAVLLNYNIPWHLDFFESE